MFCFLKTVQNSGWIFFAIKNIVDKAVESLLWTTLQPIFGSTLYLEVYMYAYFIYNGGSRGKLFSSLLGKVIIIKCSEFVCIVCGGCRKGNRRYISKPISYTLITHHLLWRLFLPHPLPFANSLSLCFFILFRYIIQRSSHMDNWNISRLPQTYSNCCRTLSQPASLIFFRLIRKPRVHTSMMFFIYTACLPLYV